MFCWKTKKLWKQKIIEMMWVSRTLPPGKGWTKKYSHLQPSVYTAAIDEVGLCTLNQVDP
jgi:hypothetical protein